MNEKKKNIRFVLILNAVIAALFLSGQYYGDQIGIKKIILMGGVVCILMVIIPLLTSVSKTLNETAGKVRLCIKDTCTWIRNNPKKMLTGAGMYVCAGILSLLVTFIVSKIQARNFIAPLFHMCFALLSILVSVYLCRKQAAKRPELLFFVIILISGTFFINASPTELGVTWDDEAHYERSLSMANLPSGVLYYADQELFMKQAETALEHFGYSEADRAERDAYLNEVYSDKVLVPYQYKGMGNYSTLSYVPFAFGLTVARGLHLPFTLIFRFAKWMNLLTYAGLIAYAMSRLRFGKILAGCVALLPTMTFMASTFAYDPFVVGMMTVGFSVFFSYLQNPESKMRNVDIAIICISFLLGCLPKAVYCVIMLPLLFMPKDRFVSKQQHTLYILSGCLTVGLLASTFIIPRIIGGMGTGDVRGGSEVDATAQTAFIKENPGKFIGVLWYFLTSTYLRPSNMPMYMENYAYLGVALKNYATPLMLYAVAFLDRDGTRSKNLLISVSSLIGVALGILIVSFTFYLSYTPVGYHTILGCQFRYQLPMVFLFLYTIGFDRFRNPIRRDIFNTVPFVYMAFSFIIYTGIQLITLF